MGSYLDIIEGVIAVRETKDKLESDIRKRDRESDAGPILNLT